MPRTTIHVGDSLAVLRTMPADSVHCVVTSPPYWGLRDYGVDGQMGLEETPEAFLSGMVELFREVRRVLRSNGTLWLNMGDSYAGSSGSGGTAGKQSTNAGSYHDMGARMGDGLKPKDLCGMPWRLALALQHDGWWLRQDIIWHKPNPMPESVRDRCTKAHEYVFLLTKSERYHYDADAIAEPAECPRGSGNKRGYAVSGQRSGENANIGGSVHKIGPRETRNKRSVWSITTQPFSDAHFATMPEELAASCIRAGCPEGGTVLDPFGGAGTTAVAANGLGRDCVLVELNPDYADIAAKRIKGAAPMFREVVVV